MSEVTEPRTTEAPAWLELPDAEIKPEKVQLWVCMGTGIPPKRKWPWSKPSYRVQDLWIFRCATKEEAEAYASRPNVAWKWNGRAAIPATLADGIANARRGGWAGVRIKAYRDGKWVTIREFPAGVPLGDTDYA